MNAKTKQKPEDNWSHCGPAVWTAPKPDSVSSYATQIWLFKGTMKINITKIWVNIYNALISCMCVRHVLLYVSICMCCFGPWIFVSMFAVLIESAEQQQCVAYSSACYLKCPSAKLKQMRWHSARTNLNSAMTQTVCPKTLAGFAMSNFAELVCKPKSASFTHFSKAREEKPQMPKAEQQVSLFTEKMGSVLLHQQQYCQSSLSCNYLPLQIICWLP